MFERAGFETIETRAIDVPLDFSNFYQYWRAQTPPLHPNVKAMAALKEKDRAKVIDLARAEKLMTRSDGSITIVVTRERDQGPRAGLRLDGALEITSRIQGRSR